jgi:transposase
MTTAANHHGCPNCGRLQSKVERLQAEVETLKAQVATLESELAQARKHSGNSSKPPSTDIVRPGPAKSGKPGQAKKRKRGAQPGHARQERTPFSPDEINRFWEWRYPSCPCCSGPLADASQEPKTLQQVEIRPQPTVVEQHASIAQWCAHCRKLFYPPFPEQLVKAGLVGPRLTALVGWFKGVCHMSISSIRRFFRDVIGVRISRGLLAKVVNKVSQSLKDPYDELLNLLTSEQWLNVDETGHKDSGRRMWTWCFRAYLYTVFRISPSRGSDVLVEVLGKEFNGILGCDYFSAYRKYMKDFNVALQFCLAHLIRDYKFLAEHPDPRNREYGRRLLEHFRKLFGIIHRREEYQSEETFRRALERARNDLVWEATSAFPATTEAANLADRFFLHTESYFRFITTPGVEPTNNLAEQAIRYIAIHRRLTQGTRGETGQAWVERIATVIVTCDQQGRSTFKFLCEAVDSFLAGNPAPSLAPDTS